MLIDNNNNNNNNNNNKWIMIDRIILYDIIKKHF